MTSKYEPAGVWLRVSTADQSEANQWPDVREHCMSRGYRIVRKYVVHGKSAYHGAQDPDWRKVVADAKAHKITVVVIWKVDRLDRQNILHAVPMVNDLLGTGARVEFSSQPYIDLTNSAGRMAFANFCEMAFAESQTKSDRVRIAFDAIDRNRSFRGRPTYGYRSSDGEKYRKGLVIYEPEATVLREARDRYLYDEQTLDTIVADFNTRGIASPMFKGKPGTRWYARTLAGYLRNPATAGRRLVGGKVVYECDGIFTWDEHLRLVARLDSRAHRAGISPSNVALLTGVLVDSEGHPMWAINKGRPSARYYCRVCHVGVGLAEADAEISQFFERSETPYMVEVLVPGENHADEIARKRQDRSELDDTQDDYDKRHADLTREIRRLVKEDQENPNPDHYEPVDSGKTYGQMWRESTTAERRDDMLVAGCRLIWRGDGKWSFQPGRMVVSIGSVELPSDDAEIDATEVEEPAFGPLRWLGFQGKHSGVPVTHL